MFSRNHNQLAQLWLLSAANSCLKFFLSQKKSGRLVCFFCIVGLVAFSAEPRLTVLPGHVPAAVSRLAPNGRLSAANNLSLAIGLPLRNPAELDELLRQLYDPASTNYHKFLALPEFTARFGPTAADYAAVRKFAEANGFRVTSTYPNRVVLDVQASAANIERAFHVALRTYRHPTEARDFFAPNTEPSVPSSLNIVSVEGLSDFSRPHRADKKISRATKSPLSFNGTGPGHQYAGNDFRNAYVPGTALNGAGQTVALLEYSDYYKVDITNYENIVGAVIGTTNYVPLFNVVVSGSTPSTSANDEVALDIETAISMAPMLSQVIVYEKNSVLSSLLNRIATDNLAKQVSSSWMVGNWSSGTATTYDNILKNMATQGQSYFQSAGDSDAYTGTQPLDSGITIPADSPYATVVGGTTLTMNGYGVTWNSETVWNYNLNGIPNEGSGGGISAYYTQPYWQTNTSMAGNGGSTTFRNIPDVSLTADDIFVSYNNGDTSGTYYFMGTSAAAPLWAGFCALANQQSLAGGGSNLGFLNPAFYTIANASCYTNCFHDITTGNNIGTNTAGSYYAVSGYDLATGIGSPTGTNLINALISPPPTLTSQPAGKNVTNGTSITFTATASSLTPMSYFWLLNGTNLPAGGNVSGVATNTLTITAATTNNSGNYQLVASNATGSAISRVAVLNVGFAPVVATSPVSQTNLAGSNVVFTATVTGSSPLVYQWLKGGTNISGAITNVLTLTAVVITNSGNFSLKVTNIFGVVTSSVASLTVVLPPSFTGSVTNRALECGKNTNTFAITAVGTAPLSIQWSTNGVSVLGATNSSFTLTNLHLPSQTVAVAVTNLYGTATSNCVLTITDTLVPVITLNGASRLTNELGSGFTNPGATATDLCAGTVPVTTNGVVNTAVVGTNTLTYTATDGSNSATNTRTVVVRDTTPPTILWSFTNLIMAANSNCVALMTNVTGTNFILATDLSGALTITQSPTNNAVLSLGTNVVVITVADASGNKSYSTNRVLVVDLTPPSLTLNGNNPLTNELGFAFTDPGVTAGDACSGLALVATNGVVNINAVGATTLTYTAVDGSGNTNTVTRLVVIRDTTPPAIIRSFTNLVLALDTNCSAAMPDVMGTNFILATDLSGAVAISQTPTNTAILQLGTNVVVIVVTDASGNTAYSTNQILVVDSALPVFVTEPQSQTNVVGTSATFTAAATACTPLAWQWWFNSTPLTAQTNSTLTLSNLVAVSAGNYSVVAASAGGSSTSAVATLTVNLFSSSVALAASVNPAGFKDSLNFTAVVAPTNATGTVQFFTNTTAFDLEPLVAGAAASTNLSTLPRGTNLVTAIYSGDGSYLPATNSLAQIVTNHPPVVTPAFYTLVAGLDLNIAVADLATNWSDADGDALVIAAIATSTNGVAVTNTVPTLFYSNPNFVSDQFVCTVSDGFGGTNFQTVTITVVPQTNSTPNIAGVASQPPGVSLKLTGGYGSTYILESTTNFPAGDWSPVATNTLGVTGVWQFTDTQAAGIPNRFYRLKLVQ